MRATAGARLPVMVAIALVKTTVPAFLRGGTAPTLETVEAPKRRADPASD